jgi:hypothetical protein
MPSAQTNAVQDEVNRREVLEEAHHEFWKQWPVNWSAVWAGALASLAAVVVLGLIGVAIGAHVTGPDSRVVDLRTIGMLTLAFSVFSAFLSFVLGGWVAGKIAGILHSEPAMIHGAIVWLLSIPLLVALAGLGAGSYLGGWHGGLAGTPSWATPAAAPFDRPEQPLPGASADEVARYRADMKEYREKVDQWRKDAPRVARNSALGAVTALLLALMGSVIGGWMASGEPMTLTYRRDHNRTRAAQAEQGRVHV